MEKYTQRKYYKSCKIFKKCQKRIRKLKMVILMFLIHFFVISSLCFYQDQEKSFHFWFKFFWIITKAFAILLTYRTSAFSTKAACSINWFQVTLHFISALTPGYYFCSTQTLAWRGITKPFTIFTSTIFQTITPYESISNVVSYISLCAN